MDANAAVNCNQSSGGTKRLALLGSFHRGGISRIQNTDSEATPKPAICAKAGDIKNIG